MAQDVYLGANEASALVGAWGERQWERGNEGGWGGWRGRGRGERIVGYGQQGWGTPTVAQPQWGGWNQHNRHHRHHNEWERRKWEWEQQNPGQPFVGRNIALLAGTLALSGIEPGSGPAPRAWLRDMPDPTMANRQVLPMNTGTTSVPQSLTANITSRPQRVAFRPERVFVSAADIGGSGSAANWIVNDITIGNRSQFAQSGALPGDMFSNVAIDSFVTFETAQTAMDVTMIVTYQGATYGGTPFYGSIIGTAAV